MNQALNATTMIENRKKRPRAYPPTNRMKPSEDSESTLVPIPATDQPGVLRADVDPVNHEVRIDFDRASDFGRRHPQSGGDARFDRAPSRYCKTILHLGGRASGAAEQKIERKAQKIAGIRRARATFMGGVMTVTFDDATLSEDQVLERVRETGAPVKRFAIEKEERPENLREWFVYLTSRGIVSKRSAWCSRSSL